MPQLDKVTLFSQVFWLLFLYFFFFLIYLKYFLPTFSKIFKVRSYFTKIQNNTNISAGISNKSNIELFKISNLLLDFNNQLSNTLVLLQKHYLSELNFYNSNVFKEINKLFISIFLKNCLRFNLYKNTILK